MKLGRGKAVGEKDDFLGALTLMELLNDSSENGSQNILLDHFARASTSESPNSCEPYLIFSCLHSFFTGKSLGIKFFIEERETEVIPFLADKLELPQEFLEVLHIFFTSNTMQYTQAYLKF